MKYSEFLEKMKVEKQRKPPRMTEHNIQVACVRWFRLQYPRYLIVAFPNAARRSPRMGAWMKDEGLTAGVADLEIIVDKDILFVEMKTKKGRQQPSQRIFQEQVERLGFSYVICRSTEDFMLKVERWIKSRYAM